MILSTTRTIASLPHLATFLAECPDAVAGWGRKRSGRRAVWLAKLLRRKLALLEDGFIRSVDRSSAPISLLVDDLGVYYDAKRPSRMEHEISHGADASQIKRTQAIIKLWRSCHVSKYNHAPEFSGTLPNSYILVIDQVFGDLSVRKGLSDFRSFRKMLDAALYEHPNETIVLKIHPDVYSRAKRGYFDSAIAAHPRIQVVGVDCHAAMLIEKAEMVYCVTSLMGFEAMLWGKPVRCFGMPFYAGWGLTDDEQRPPVRRQPATLDDIAHAALIALPRYVDPNSGRRWEVEQAIAHIARARERMASMNTEKFFR